MKAMLFVATSSLRLGSPMMQFRVGGRPMREPPMREPPIREPPMRRDAARDDYDYRDRRSGWDDYDYRSPSLGARYDYGYRGQLPSAYSAYPADASMHVQGRSLRTWSDPWGSQLELGTDGRPLDASIEVWQGPNYTPRRMRVYSEDGRMRPFRGMEMPSGRSSLAVRNQGPLEFPMSANFGRGAMSPQFYRGAMPPPSYRGVTSSKSIQGGASRSFPINPWVDSVQVDLMSEGRNINAKIELLQGPNNVRQLIELDEDDGYNRPFTVTLDTLGYGCVVRIVNTAPIEFPIIAAVTPHATGAGYTSSYDRSPDIGGSFGGRYEGQSMGRYEAMGRYNQGRGYDQGRWWE